MVNLFKKWLKIYLFYGAIFFLLGLFGYLASDQVILTNWSARQIQKLNHVWSLVIFPKDKVQVIPAFSNKSAEIILQIYQNADRDKQYENLLLQLRSRLQRHFNQVVIIPVADLNHNGLETVNLNTPLILIGYKQFPDMQRNGLAMRTLYFSIPEPAEELFTRKFLQNIMEKVPSFHFKKQVYGYNTIYEFNWEKNGNTENIAGEVFSTFLNVFDQEVIKALCKPSYK